MAAVAPIDAVIRVLRRMQDDGRVAYLIGPGSQTFADLTQAYAEANGLDVEAYRKEFAETLRPERVRVVES